MAGIEWQIPLSGNPGSGLLRELHVGDRNLEFCRRPPLASAQIILAASALFRQTNQTV